MNKYTRIPKAPAPEIRDLYNKFNLRENPFPYNPFIEPESEDPKRNGKIFDEKIRNKELEKFKKHFLENPIDGDHNRIGYLLESSFTGRGNGKSAFLVNIQSSINEDLGAKVSNDVNKTFSIYFKAKASGQNTKFWQISQEIIKELANKKIIESALISLRFKVLKENDWLGDIEHFLVKESDYEMLLDNKWINERIEFTAFHSKLKYKMIDAGISNEVASFLSYYSSEASKKLTKYIDEKPEPWRKKELNRLLFDELVRFFLLCDFNGCYILLDEFEKIADFQKPTERIEFAYEIRQNLLESNLQSGITGFFIFIITMHPGTQRLILEAWEKSGINARSPLPGDDFMEAPHVISFEDIKKQDIQALLKVYLDYYRIDTNNKNKSNLYPFDEAAVDLIANVSKFNAARILKLSHIILSELVQTDKEVIDSFFVSDIINKNKKFPQEDINSSNFLSRENNPLENALFNIKLKEE